MTAGAARAMFRTASIRCEFHIENGVYKANEKAHNEDKTNKRNTGKEISE